MVVHHLLLAGAVAALSAAGIRAASQLSGEALERVVAAAVLAATAAGTSGLGLGLVELGSSPVALLAAAVAVWLAARLAIPAAELSLGEQLSTEWGRLPLWGRLAIGALVGAFVAWTAWLLEYPGYGWDNLTYHIPEIVAWIENGRPGSIEPILPGWPVGNYPLTNELLVAWGAGISRSFVWITVWPALMIALLAGSGWLGLRALRVPPSPARSPPPPWSPLRS